MTLDIPRSGGRFADCLICSDIDMTYYMQGRVPERNERMLEKYREEGGLFSFASGRNHFDLPIIIKNLHKTVNVPNVLCNGAEFFDPRVGVPEDATYLDRERAEQLFREIYTLFPDICFRCATDRGFAVPETQTNMIAELERAGLLPVTNILPIEKVDGTRTFKAVFVADPEKLVPVRRYIAENYSDVFDVTASSPRYTELQPKGVTKACGVLKLKSEVARIRPGVRLFCIGDYYNDIEMLEAADVAVCPSNAADEVKAVCDRVLCHCSEGAVGDLIEKIAENVF